MPWLGLFSHENTIVIPNNYNKTIVITTEDDVHDQSQLYAFVSDTPNDFLRGNGQLYVLLGENDNNISSFRDLEKGNEYNGHFKSVDWDWKTQNSSDLENEVQELNAIDFIRLEDTDYNRNDNSIFYVADTGTNKVGDEYKNGRIYEFKLNHINQTLDSFNNFDISFSIILDGDKGDDMRNPDNMAISNKSLMIQEDLNDYNRVDSGVNARILKYDLGTTKLEPVSIVDQFPDSENPHISGQWESSGIVEAFDAFGPGSWLLDTQAHSLAEGGQLLIMNIPNS